MNRKQKKAKRQRATQHTKSQAQDWKKYDTPCSDLNEATECERLCWTECDFEPKPNKTKMFVVVGLMVAIVIIMAAWSLL